MPVISINSAPNKPTYPSDPAAPTYFPEDARQYILASNFVGSRVTCFPPPQDTDLDILVRVTNKKFVETLLRYGWQYCSDGYDVVTDWKAFKKKKTACIFLKPFEKAILTLKRPARAFLPFERIRVPYREGTDSTEFGSLIEKEVDFRLRCPN